MQKVKFNDGTEIPLVAAFGKQIFVQGAQRDALEIQIAKDALTIDALDKLIADGIKTGKFTVVDGDVQYVRENYCIRAELAIKPVVTATATSTTPEVTEDRLCVTLAQLTYAEVQAQQSAAAVAALGQQVAALTLQAAKGGVA
jgi:hypothetical protein